MVVVKGVEGGVEGGGTLAASFGAVGVEGVLIVVWGRDVCEVD